MAFIDKYHKFLEKYRILVIVFWVIILGFGIWLGPKFLDETSSTFDPPEDSPSKIAEHVMIEEFPVFVNQTNFIILIRMNQENVSILNSEIETFCNNLNSSVYQYEDIDEIIVSVLYYYLMIDSETPEAAQEFISSEERSMIFVIELLMGQKEDALENFAVYLREKMELHNPEGSDFSTYLTGFIVMYYDMSETVEKDMATMDMIVIPIALVVLAFVLRSLRLMIIPILSMVISILTSFFFMYPIALALDIFSFVPSIMMSLVIALSIDYSLFLLTRYREEILKKKNNSDAVKLMSEHSGHTILVSALTLTITFLGLIFFPLDLLSTMGIGAAFAILLTLLINLTLTPALLLTFGKFFSNFSMYRKLSKKAPETEEETKKIELEKQFKSVWFKVGKFSTRYAPFVIIVIIVAAIPISIQVFKFKRSMDFEQILPRGSQSSEAYIAMKEDFDPGTLLPFYLIIRTNETNGILNSSFYLNSITLLTRLSSETELNNNSFTSIVRAGDYWIDFSLALPFLFNVSASYDSSLGVMYRYIFDRYTNVENSTTMIDIQTPFDPWGDDAEEFIRDARIILKEFEDETGYDVHLAGGSAFMLDAIDDVYRLFPLMIIITVIVVYVVIAIMFKSIFIPLRLILTIGLTISWIYGLGVFVFETTYFDKLIPALKGVQGFYWITPIMSLTILLGLGLDYDIFILSRISEFRDKGFTEKASIHKALFKTGNIISFAGIIMAIAFSGLMFSREMVLNQFGFMLCVAVLIDTFIIRTILVPAIMSLATRWNWWPAKKPEPSKDENDIE
jgi:uncharacterized membrane protein YdfJ with MMPL/SSD domain